MNYADFTDVLLRVCLGGPHFGENCAILDTNVPKYSFDFVKGISPTTN